MWRWIVAAWAPAPSKSTIIEVISVPAFKCLTIIGTVSRGDVRVICLTLCVSITISRHKRPGNGYKQDGKHEQAVGRGRGGGVAGGGLSLASACPALSLGTRLPLTR